MSLPTRVKVVEVSPRDGLQNEAHTVPTEIKLQLINLLAESGLKNIEATSFVRAPKIPQLADAEELMQQLDTEKDIDYPVLIPNTQGLERALEVGVKSIAVFTSISESFNKRNINCSIEESMQRIEAVANIALKHNIKIRAYISCVHGCPYEGKTNQHLAATMAKDLLDLGCYEVSLGDTIGIGTARQTQELIQHMINAKLPLDQLAIHFHDTYGQALINIFAALQMGISTVDASVAGLGGCPYAKGASGNVSTEDVLYLLNGLDIETGIDLKKLIQAGNFISDYLKRPNHSKVAAALS